MTDEQEVSMANSLEKIVNALQLDPVRKFLEQKDYESRLMKAHGPDLVNAWKKEFVAVDQAKQYVEHEAKIYREKYELTRKLLANIMMECDIKPRRNIDSNSSTYLDIEETFREYKEAMARISSQYDKG